MITEDDLKKLCDSRKTLESIRLQLGHGSLAVSARHHLNEVDRSLAVIEQLLKVLIVPARSPR